VRNLGLIVAFWLTALLPINSFALGLGEIEVNSFLNQPLNAEIEVLSARPGEIDDLLVSLASRDAFARAGLERPRHLSELRFEVKRNEAGDSAVILVTTRSAVKEPFLNFLVEADWSQGRLLREFTVLLDPPFYADQPAPVEPTTSAAPEPAADSEPAQPYVANVDTPSSETSGGGGITEPIALSGDSSSSPGPSPPASSEYVSDESQNIIEGDVLVVKGDTLWSIASLYKDREHSMSQVMLAFQRTNPNAFNDGNINNMKKGAVLRAPSAAEIDALDKQAAQAEVLLQNGLWNEYVERVTGVAPATGGSAGGSAAATRSAGAESATSESATSQGELSLLLPGDGDSSSTGTGDSAEINELRTKLALAEEELEASRIENKDLESRIGELQARLSKVEELQKMVEIEDDSLAQLQAGQSQDSMAEDASGETAGVDAAVSDTLKADEDALLEELLAEEAAAQADELAALQQGDKAAGESETSDMVSEDTIAAAEGSGDQMMNDEAGAAKATPPPAAVIITEPVSAGNGSILDGILPADMGDMIPSIDGLLTNPIILAAVGGVIVLLLILVLLKRRKAAQDDEPMMAGAGADDLFAGDDEDELTPIQLAEVDDHMSTDIKVPSSADMSGNEVSQVFEEAEEEDEYAATATVSAADTPESEGPAASVGEQDDVLNEVDVYLAYGLYDNAEDLLNSSIADRPERADYRSKLLDTYFATRKVDAFVKEAQNLKSMGDAASSYWDRVQIMGYELAPNNALFSDARNSGLSAADLEIAKPQEADFDLGANDEDDINFSSANFNLGEEGADFSQGEAGGLESTQEVSSVGAKSSTDNLDDEINLSELSGDIGEELEFSMDDDAGNDAGKNSEDDDLDLMGDLQLDDGDDDLALADDLDLADADKDEPELSLADEADDEDDIALDFDSDEFGGDDDLNLDDALQITPPDEDDSTMEKTAIITPNYQDTEVFRAVNVEDAAAASSDDDDEEEDISIIDFGGDDFEYTGQTESVGADDDFELDDDEGEEIRTGTFAPGDFDEPTAAISSLADIDDMDDLMLPDDVDEVSTKLDLARAFIDMGDTEGARGSLEEVMSEGNAEQKAEAKSLLDQI